MSKYIEFDGRIAFHPAYYIEEIIEQSGLTQEDFAKRLDTTPKNLSDLLKGEQRLSVDMAMKLSRMLDTSINYWLNLQSNYDALMAEFDYEKELEKERKIFNHLDYKYFVDNFKFPALPRQINKQITVVRKFLDVSTLSVLAKKNLAVSFRSSATDMTEANIVKANTMVQIAVNEALKIEAPKFDRKKFQEAFNYALTLTDRHDEFYRLVYNSFLEAGVKFIVLPNIKGSRTNGATKRLGDNILLMVNDRRQYSDTFWFTLFHEIGHIMNGDFGISFENETGEEEEIADRFAQDSLIPPEKYHEFILEGNFDVDSIKNFSLRIGRDPAIVVGRLQNDHFLRFDDWETKSLRQRYSVRPAI